MPHRSNSRQGTWGRGAGWNWKQNSSEHRSQCVVHKAIWTFTPKQARGTGGEVRRPGTTTKIKSSMLDKSLVYYPSINFSHLECSGPRLQACSFLLWAHAIQIFWISLSMFRFQSRDLFLFPVCQWERVCCASCLSHALCDFLLMVCGVLKHNNIFKRHLLLYKLKNTDVLFVSLILKPIVLFLTMLAWTVWRNCIRWMRNGTLASGNTMFWLLSFIMCSNHMAIHLLFSYWTTVLQTCTEHAVRKSRREGVNGS